MTQDTRYVQSKILELESQRKDALDKCSKSQTVLKTIENATPDIQEGIVQREAVKYHVGIRSSIVISNLRSLTSLPKQRSSFLLNTCRRICKRWCGNSENGRCCRISKAVDTRWCSKATRRSPKSLRTSRFFAII